MEYNFNTLLNSQFLGFFKKGQINIYKSSFLELGTYRGENMIFDINPVLVLKLPQYLYRETLGPQKHLGKTTVALSDNTS